MKWALHHVNFPAHNLQKSIDFYQNILGFTSSGPHAEGTSLGHLGVDEKNLAVIGEDNKGVHLLKPMPGLAQKLGLPVNPAVGGHIAFAVSDLEGAKKRLIEAGVVVADARDVAPGVAQIYFYDPAMNMIELTQTTEE